MKTTSIKSPILLKAYGRLFQNIVERVSKLKNKEQRSACCKELIKIMQKQNSTSTEPILIEALWQELFFISGFNLDIDSNIPLKKENDIIQTECINSIKPFTYYQRNGGRSSYGRNVLNFLEVAKKTVNKEELESILIGISRIIFFQDKREISLEHVTDYFKDKLGKNKVDSLLDLSSKLQSIVELNKINQKQANNNRKSRFRGKKKKRSH